MEDAIIKAIWFGCLVFGAMFVAVVFIFKPKARYLILGLFLIFISCLSYLYETPFVRWMYIEGNRPWNIAITYIGPLLLFIVTVFLGETVKKFFSNRKKAKAAGMTVAEFKKWRKQTLASLIEKIERDGREVDYLDLFSAYEEEENKLLSR